MFYLCERCDYEGRGVHNGLGIAGTCGECWKADLQAARARIATLDATSTGDDMRDVMLDVLGLLEQCEVRR